MKRVPFLLLSASFAAAATAPAQHITTVTDFGVLARVNRQVDHQAVPAGTAVARGLRLRAAAAASRDDGATAVVVGERVSRPEFGAGLRLQEHAFVSLADPNAIGEAGTSPSPLRGTPAVGRHALSMQYPVAAGTNGVVTVLWRGQATRGASAGVGVDVDGDGMADFHGIADGNPVQMQFRVTAGGQGVVVGIVATGRVGIHGRGRAGYAASLGVFFREASTTPNCTFTAFGPQCGGRLSGSVHSGRLGDFVELDVSGAAAGALGALILGRALPAPVPLPGSRCDLLVDPFVWTPVRIDAMGDGSARVPLRSRLAMDVDFQVVTLSLSGGIRIASTNALNLRCR